MNPLSALATARELHDTLCAAMCHADTRTISKLLATDATLTHMTGYVQSKNEWLGEIQAGNMKYYSIRTVSAATTADGYVFTTLCDANIWGMRNNWHLGLRYTLQPDSDKIANIIAFSW